jgi:hypothetical protein
MEPEAGEIRRAGPKGELEVGDGVERKWSLWYRLGKAMVSSPGRQWPAVHFLSLEIEERCNIGRPRHRCGSRAGYSACTTGKLYGVVGAASRWPPCRIAPPR